MPGPFRVAPSQVGALDPHTAVDLAARLVRADAAASGITPSLFDMPPNLAARDGGVDGTVADSPRQSLHGLVKEGLTAYLFRPGALVPARSIPDMLLARGEDGDVKPRIRSCLEAGGTLVVLLFGWDGPPPPGADTEGGSGQRDMAGRILDTLSSRPGSWEGARVDVWGRNRIVAALEEFPSLALELGGIHNAGFAGHLQWSRLADMLPAFMRGAAERSAMEKIRSALVSDAKTVHVRVTGEAGSGKTRLALEALRADGLSARVVYAPDPDAGKAAVGALRARSGMSPADPAREGEEGAASAAASTGPILVVDECDPANQASIWNEVLGLEDGTRLVTIYNERGIGRSGVVDVLVKGTGDEQIADIIREYIKESDHGDAKLEEWVKYCRPSPRAAHIVGQNLVGSPDDLFRPPGNVLVWERWISSGRGPGSPGYEDRRIALMWLSLFTKFGMDEPHGGDMREIARLAAEHHPELTWHRFRRAARSLRDMRVIQGHTIAYISPRLLHDYMWIQWWNEYGPGGVPRAFWPGGGVDAGAGGPGSGPAPAGLPPLDKRFLDMLEGMRNRKEASPAVRRLFSGDGPLPGAGTEGARDALASDLFAAACAASPEAGLSYAERAVAAMPADARRRLAVESPRAGRLAAILQRMLRDRRTFARAARLLFAIACAGAGAGEAGGTERRLPRNACDTDAERAVRDAFDPAPPAGFSDAPLGERLEALAGAVRGGGRGPGDETCACLHGSGGGAAGGGEPAECGARLAAVRACGDVLRMEDYSPAIPCATRMFSNTRHWAPDDRAGTAAYLRGVIGLLKEAARDPGAGGAVRAAAAQSLLGGLAQAAPLPEIAEDAVGAAEGLAADGLIDGEALLAVAERLAEHESDRIEPAALARVRALVGRAEAAGLHERLVRHVGTGMQEVRGRLGTYGNTGELRRLAAELHARPGALDAEIEWLASGDADWHAAALLGRELAALAGGFGEAGRTVMHVARRALSGGNGKGGIGGLLQGYVAGLCRSSPGAAEDVLDDMIKDKALRGLVPDVHLMAGAVSDRSASRLAGAVRDGLLARHSLACLALGAPFAEVGEERFRDLLDAMAAGGGNSRNGHSGGPRPCDRAASAHALVSMLHAYYFRNGRNGAGAPARRMDEKTALAVLLDEDVLATPAGAFSASRVDFDKWFEAVQALLGQAGDAGGADIAVARAVIARLGRPGLLEDEDAIRRLMPVLDRIAMDHPREAWEAAAAHIDPARDRGPNYVRAWLRGESDGMHGPAAADGNGGLLAIPMRMVVEWAARDGSRPGNVAMFLPPRLEVVREFVARFGYMDDVRDGLSFTFERGLAAGDAAANYGAEIARLEEARRAESDPNVAGWLDGHLALLRERLAGIEAVLAQDAAEAAA